MASWTDRRRSPAWGRGLVFGAGSAGAVAWGERCRSVGRQEAVAKRPWHWVTQAGAQPQPQPRRGSAGLFLGEVEVGLWRGLCEVEVEGRAMASWTDRRRSPAWGRGLVFGAGSAGAVAWGERCRSVCRQEAVAKRPCPWVTPPGPSPSDVALAESETSTSTLALVGERCRSRCLPGWVCRGGGLAQI